MKLRRDRAAGLRSALGTALFLLAAACGLGTPAAAQDELAAATKNPGQGTFADPGLARAPGVAGAAAPVTRSRQPGNSSLAITPVTGLWWNSVNFETLTLSVNAYGQYVVMYYTEAGGTPLWFISDVAVLEKNTFSSVFYMSHWDYETGTNTLTTAGTVSLSFDSATQATFTWNLYPYTAGSTTYQLGFGGGAKTGMYYPPSMPGIGLMLAEQYGSVIANVAFYDANGTPTWALGGASSAASMYFPLEYGTGSVWAGSASAATPPYGGGYLNVSFGLPNFEFSNVPFYILAY